MTRTRNRPGGGTGAASQVIAATRETVAASIDDHHELRVPAAYATAYSPAGRRKRAAAMVRCPHCKGGHLIYGGLLDDLGGIRTVACGRVRVVIARVVRAVSDVG